MYCVLIIIIIGCINYYNANYKLYKFLLLVKIKLTQNSAKNYYRIQFKIYLKKLTYHLSSLAINSLERMEIYKRIEIWSYSP